MVKTKDMNALIWHYLCFIDKNLIGSNDYMTFSHWKNIFPEY